jgi:tol-pal system protein YbgF
MDAQRGLSEEWRLRSLEENFLNFKETQREQEERGRDQQRKLLDRVRAVEETLARMEQGGMVPAKAAPLASAPTARVTAPAQPAMEPSPLASQDLQPPSAVPAGGKSLYDQGMTLVRAEKSADGRKTLLEFLEVDPKSALVPNALYWIGESHYQEKNYAQGILTFKEVTRRFPKHHKAAAALYKIGMSYVMMGEKDNATLYLRALLKEHPKSEPAPAARKKLAELGG